MRGLFVLLVSLVGCVPGPMDADTELQAAEVRLEQVYGLGSAEVAEIIEARTLDGTPIWVALDYKHAPMFVGVNVAQDNGYWTATVDYVYGVGGSCVSP